MSASEADLGPRAEEEAEEVEVSRRGRVLLGAADSGTASGVGGSSWKVNWVVPFRDDALSTVGGGATVAADAAMASTPFPAGIAADPVGPGSSAGEG